MGLFDTISLLAKGVMEFSQQLESDVDKSYKRGKNMTDEQLIRRGSNSLSRTERAGYAKALKERGYGKSKK